MAPVAAGEKACSQLSLSCGMLGSRRSCISCRVDVIVREWRNWGAVIAAGALKHGYKGCVSGDHLYKAHASSKVVAEAAFGFLCALCQQRAAFEVVSQQAVNRTGRVCAVRGGRNPLGAGLLLPCTSRRCSTVFPWLCVTVGTLTRRWMLLGARMCAEHITFSSASVSPARGTGMLSKAAKLSAAELHAVPKGPVMPACGIGP